MVTPKPTQEEKAFLDTAMMFYPTRVRHAKQWSIGVGAYLDLVRRVDYLEAAMKHGLQPAMREWVRLRERYGERDTIPAAASAAYEWRSQVIKVADIVDNMLVAFEDLERRLSYHVNLIQQVSELLKLARSMGNRNIRDAVLTLHDALSGIYSEDLTSTQAEVIGSIVRRLHDPKWNREQVRALDKELRECGFETVPSDRFVGLYSERSHT